MVSTASLALMLSM